MIGSILAAVDFSSRAAGVARAAIELADKFGATVHLFRALAVPQEYPAAASNAPDALQPFLEDEARAQLRELAGTHQRVVVEPLVVLHGQPWRAIIAESQRLKVDLIVIGSHGFGGWDRVLGTTAGKVVNHADRSVLVVHEQLPAGAAVTQPRRA